MSKVTKNERISTLEDAVAMNWSDMKKIETKISRAMTDMATRISNISLQLEGQQRQIHLAADSIGLNKRAIIMLENEREAEAEPEPQLKQLDQSIFDGLDEKWRFAAISKNGSVYKFRFTPKVSGDSYLCDEGYHKHSLVGTGYDASNWQNSLIERNTVKELTGSSLCRAMLERGDKFVLCFVSDFSDEYAANQGQRINLVTHTEGNNICAKSARWKHAVPFNSRTGHPLTAKEVGL